MKTILITCIRAPVSIEWIKVALRSKHKVILVDSLDYPIGRFYKGCTYIKVPSPRIDFDAYKKMMIDLFHQVDLVIPNCEDIFFLAKVKDSKKFTCKFFMPDTNLLFKLHNKYQFFETMNTNVKFPITKLIKSKGEIDFDFISVLKPVFSRFGTNVIRDVNIKSTENIYISKTYPWVQQQFCYGEAVCNYAICENGKVLSHTAYKPMYLLNGAAASYFRYKEDKRCESFIKEFAKDNNYTGQVAFDFVDDGKSLYILECNPRATSGLHIVSKSLYFDEKLNIKTNGKKIDGSFRVGSSLFIFFGFKALFKGEFIQLIKDHLIAKNILSSLPWYSQFFSLAEMIKRSFIFKRSLTSASTFDIEYDGEDNV